MSSATVPAADYWKSIPNIILRCSATVFSLVSFALIADPKWNGNTLFTISDEAVYVFSINVITLVYSLAHVAFYTTVKLSKSMKFTKGEFLLTHFIFFIGDQVLAYFLLSSGSSGVTRVKQLNDYYRRSLDYDDYLSRVLSEFSGGAAMAIMSFFAVAISAIFSGYHLVEREAATSTETHPEAPGQAQSLEAIQPSAPPQTSKEIVPA